jgi:septal ring factor EnvC (AmiA/AmiB activator)
MSVGPWSVLAALGTRLSAPGVESRASGRFVRARSVLLLLAVLALGAPLAAQQSTSTEARLRAQREELERVRRERDDLERRMEELRGKAHDLSDEVTNIHRQAEATARVVSSLDTQLATISGEVDSTTANLAHAEQELETKRVALRRRVVAIYKRGPLYSAEALLSAQSFGQLVARYKYLHELARRDRALVDQVAGLYDEIASQRQLLVRLQQEFERNRTDKANEERRLRALEQSRGRSLVQVRRSEQDVQQRLERIRRDETRLANVITALEETRRRAEAKSSAAGAAPTTSSIRTSDFGKLDWPVQGTILYRFGRAVNPNNTTIRWNGVGIGASSGAAVRAVASGEVMLAEPIGTYGLTVIIQHGGGDYSVYGSLATASVEKGQRVAKGQTIGTVGVSDPELPPHLHFEIRPKGRAMDPLAWLRAAAAARD